MPQFNETLQNGDVMQIIIIEVIISFLTCMLCTQSIPMTLYLI